VKLLKGKRLIPVLLDNLSSNPIKLFFKLGFFKLKGFSYWRVVWCILEEWTIVNINFVTWKKTWGR